MNTLVLDTNIVSYLLKNHPFAELYRPHLEGHTLAVSFMTVGELYEGALRRSWGHNRLAELDEILQSRCVVISSSFAICDHWARIRIERRKQPISMAGAWIAATARAYGCPLVTHDREGFRGISRLDVITEAGAVVDASEGEP